MKLIFYFVKRCVLLGLFEVRNRQNFESVRNKISCAHMTREKTLLRLFPPQRIFPASTSRDFGRLIKQFWKGIKQFLLFGYHEILVTAKYWTITQFELVFKSKSGQKISKSLNWIDENKRQALRSLHVRRRFKKSADLGSNSVYLLMAMFHQRQFGFALVRTLFPISLIRALM